MRTRLAAGLLLTLQLGLVGWLALRPLTVTWVEPENLRPLVTIREAWHAGPETAARLFAAGVLPLAPLGVLLPALGRRLGGSRFVSFVRTVFVGAMIALLMQLLVSLAPSRVADVDHVLLGTVGVALVHLLCYGRLRSMLLRVPPPAPAPRAALGQEAPARRSGRGRRTRRARSAAARRRGRNAAAGTGGRTRATREGRNPAGADGTPGTPGGPQGGAGTRGAVPRRSGVPFDGRGEVLDGSLSAR